MFASAIEYACMRTKEFIRRASEEVAFELLHVDRTMGCVMHSIDKHQRTMSMRHSNNLVERIDCSHGIRGIAHSDDFGAITEFSLEILQVECAIVFLNINVEHVSAAFFECPPGRHVRVMVEN